MNNPTLITNFDDHPEWCKGNSIAKYNEFKLGQLVLDLNKTLARIIHITMSNNQCFFRLSLIDTFGNEFANVTAMYGSITIYNWKLTK